MKLSMIDILLKPVWNGEQIVRFCIRILTDMRMNAGETLLSLNRRVTNKSFVRLDGEIEIRDASGALSCRIQSETQTHADVAHYIPQRNTHGTIAITYTALPEIAGANPCFDLGYEPGGINGSGMTFLPVFKDEECQFTVDWDTSCLPPEFRCVWTYGEGKTTMIGFPSMLSQAFYYVGRLKSAVSDRFGFYWIENPQYDATEIAAWNRDAYQVLSRFFCDQNAYRIFVRRARDHKPGGTALGRSYMIIYPNDQQPVMNKFLFAHEMVHNWIHLRDEPFGTCTWYVEGMAEYYSALLLWRSGLIGKSELAAEMNIKAKQYYENPRISIPNEEAGALLFSDQDVTRVSYGRGVFYLMKTDAQIREATVGRQSLDDIMFQMIERVRTNPETDNRDWLELITAILGNTAMEEFEQMRSGIPVEPPADCFDHILRTYKTTGFIRGGENTCDVWQFE